MPKRPNPKLEKELEEEQKREDEEARKEGYEDAEEKEIVEQHFLEQQEKEESEDIEETSTEDEISQRKLRILEKLEKKIDEEEKDFSTVPFKNFPKELQDEFRKRAEELFKQDKAILDDRVKLAHQRIERIEQKAQGQIDQKLKLALSFIDAELINTSGKSEKSVKDFVNILALMQRDPLNNVQWVIRLFSTKEGVYMSAKNETEEKKQ